VWLLLWLAASVSAGAFGGRRSAVPLTAPFLAFTHLANPSSAWGQQEPGPWPYWGLTGAFLLMGLLTPSALWLWRRRAGAHARDDPSKILGVATRPEVARVAGRRFPAPPGQRTPPVRGTHGWVDR